jgi:hypothetical protein
MAIRRQRSISCSDEDWLAIRQQAGDKNLSVSEYLVSLAMSDAADPGTSNSSLSDAERSAYRAIWFLYVDRLNQIKDAGDNARVDALVAEARRKFG